MNFIPSYIGMSSLSVDNQQYRLLIGIFGSYYDNALRWKPQDPTDDKVNIGSGDGLVT